MSTCLPRDKKTCMQLMIHTWAASPIYDKKMVSTPGRSRSYECFVGAPIRILLPAVEPTNPSSHQPGLYDNRAARRLVLFRSRPQTREAPTPSGGQDGLPATAWNSIMALKQWGVSVLRFLSESRHHWCLRNTGHTEYMTLTHICRLMHFHIIRMTSDCCRDLQT